jgi:hypothetical protein
LNAVSPSKRAGGTIVPDPNATAPVADGASTTASGGPSHNGASGNGNGAGDSATPLAASGARRRTKLTSAVPAPERGTASSRGSSSSSVSKPASSVVESRAAESPAADASKRSEPAVPPTLAPLEDNGDARHNSTPLPAVVPVTPAKRGSQVPQFPTPVLLPPTLPVEPPVTSTSMSTHRVAPVPRVVGRRPRVRKVTRVVRHVDPWSVFKIAVVFNLVLYAVALTSGVLLWNVAYATGTIDNLERFFESFGWNTFEFNGGEIFHSAWIAGLFAVVGLTGAAVLGATLFNLITDLVGGVRMTVLEEEVVERTASPMRRFVVRRPTGDGAANGDGPAHPEPKLPTRIQVPEQPPGDGELG